MDEPTTAPATSGVDRRRARRRRWLLAGGIAVGVLVVAFVAWRVVGGGDLQRLAGAPDATVAAGTARVSVAATVEGVPVLSPFTFSLAEGEVDLAAQSARLRRQVLPASGVPFLDRLLAADVVLLHDGGDTYLRLPVEGEQAWVRVTDGAGDPAGGAGTAAPGLTNPVAAVGLLRALRGLPEVVGQESVRGQPSTHFRVLVDLDRAADALSGRAADLARGLRRLRGRGDLPLDVWLDGDDRVTRLRYRFEPDLPGVAGVDVTTDLELFDFGTAVDITAPSAAELVDVPSDRIRELDPLQTLRSLIERLDR